MFWIELLPTDTKEIQQTISRSAERLHQRHPLMIGQQLQLGQ